MQSVCNEINDFLNENTNKEKKKNRESDRVFTKSELLKYNGLNGKAAYVAVDGVVYNLTGIGPWGNGRHYGIAAGKDLTTYFMTCHKNQKDILNKLEIVGKIEAE